MRSSSTGDVLAPSSGSTLFEMLSRLSPARMSVRMPACDASVVIASITETLRFPGRAGVLAVGVRWRPSEAATIVCQAVPTQVADRSPNLRPFLGGPPSDVR
jgi:hypothetical protein